MGKSTHIAGSKETPRKKLRRPKGVKRSRNIRSRLVAKHPFCKQCGNPVAELSKLQKSPHVTLVNRHFQQMLFWIDKRTGERMAAYLATIHHVVSLSDWAKRRKKKSPDRMGNLMLLCAPCHRRLHEEGDNLKGSSAA